MRPTYETPFGGTPRARLKVYLLVPLSILMNFGLILVHIVFKFLVLFLGLCCSSPCLL